MDLDAAGQIPEEEGSGFQPWRGGTAPAPWLPLTFVILSLFALVAIPTIEGRLVGVHQSRLRDVAQPARRLLAEMQLELALGRSALRDYLVTGDDRYLERYRVSVAFTDGRHPRLLALVELLDPLVENAYRELRSTQAAWQDSTRVILALRASDPLAARLSLSFSDLYEETITRAAELDQAISRHSDELLDSSAAAERKFALVTLILGSCALVSAIIVVWLAKGLRHYAGEAERRRSEVERALRAKAQLIRGVTHDLKNPLGAIDGYAELLEEVADPPLSPSQASYVARLRASTASMLEMIERMLDLARAEGGLPIVSRRVDPTQLVLGVVDQYQAVFDSAGVQVAVQTDEAPRRIDTDPARAGEVLANLLSNAARYTPSGGMVDVIVTRVRSGGPRPGRWLAIAVRDTGPGIPFHEVRTIFEEFTRGESHDVPGAGLGLSIARRIARLLGGDVTLATKVRKGSTFTFWLPS
jgi:signal transduction histidine kinase